MILLLAAPPAHANAPIPEAIREKWFEAAHGVHAGYDALRAKVDSTGREEMGAVLREKVSEARHSNFVQSLGAAAGRIWGLAKQKGRGLLVKLDRKMHEKLLSGEEGAMRAE